MVISPKIENIHWGIPKIEEYSLQNDVLALDKEFQDYFFNSLQIKEKFLSRAQKKLNLFKTIHLSKYSASHDSGKGRQPLLDFVYVGVHIRRGDHLEYETENDMTNLDPQFYLLAMQSYREKFKIETLQGRIIFVLVSDDKDWAKKAILYNVMVEDTYWGGSTVPDLDDNIGNDFALLASCNHTIESHGTFSYFAGAFAGGYKIKPNHFSKYREVKHKNNTFWEQDPFNHIPPRLGAY